MEHLHLALRDQHGVVGDAVFEGAIGEALHALVARVGPVVVDQRVGATAEIDVAVSEVARVGRLRVEFAHQAEIDGDVRRGVVVQSVQLDGIVRQGVADHLAFDRLRLEGRGFARKARRVEAGRRDVVEGDAVVGRGFQGLDHGELHLERLAIQAEVGQRTQSEVVRLQPRLQAPDPAQLGHGTRVAGIGPATPAGGATTAGREDEERGERPLRGEGQRRGRGCRFHGCRLGRGSWWPRSDPSEPGPPRWR